MGLLDGGGAGRQMAGRVGVRIACLFKGLAKPVPGAFPREVLLILASFGPCTFLFQLLLGLWAATQIGIDLPLFVISLASRYPMFLPFLAGTVLFALNPTEVRRWVCKAGCVVSIGLGVLRAVQCFEEGFYYLIEPVLLLFCAVTALWLIRRWEKFKDYL